MASLIDKIIEKAKVKEELKRAGTTASHFISQAILPVVNTTPNTGRYLPAVADMLPGMVGAVRNAFTDTPKQDYFTRAANRIEGATDRTQEAFGIEDPQGLEQNIASMLGAFVMPTPGKFGPAKTVLGKTGNFLAEMAVPLRQGKYIHTVPVAAAFGAGVNAINGTASAETPPSAVRAYNGEQDFDELNFTPEPQDSELDFTPEDRDVHDELSFTPPPAAENVPEPEPLSLMDKATIGAVGLGAAVMAAATGRMVVKSLTKQKISLAGGDLIGTKYVKQQTGVGTNLASGIVQGNQAIRKAVEVEVPAAAKVINDKLDAVAPASVSMRNSHALHTGETPNSAVNLGPVRSQIEGIAGLLDETEMALLARGLAAKSAINTIKRATAAGMGNTTGPNAKVIMSQFSEKIDGSPQTFQDLEAMAAVLDNDPKLKSVANIVPDIYRKLADYSLDQGLISKSTYDEWIANNPDYVHLSASVMDAGDSTFLGIPTSKGYAISDNASKARSLLQGEGVQSGKTSNPIVNLPDQIHHVLREAQLNTMRRDVLEALDGGTVYGVKKVPEAAHDTVTVKVLGKDVHYKVTDNAVRTQLELGPNISQHAFAQAGRAVNSLFVKSTVGRALVPLFSAVTASYEGFGTMVSRQPGQHIGLINEALSKAGLSIGVFDPTAFPVFTVPVGSLRYLWDSGIQQISHELAKSMIDSDSYWAKMIPDDIARQKFADRMMVAYNNSIKASAAREGALSGHIYGQVDDLKPLGGLESQMPGFVHYANTQAAAEAVSGGATFLEKMYGASSNAAVALNSSWFARGYNTLSNAMRESVRYQLYASNMAKASTPDEVAHLVSQTRRAGGDMAQRGGGEIFNSIADWSTFVNAGIQPLVEMGKLAVKNPAGLAMNLGTVGIGSLMYQYLAAAMDPEVAAEMRNATDQQLASYVYFPGGIKVPMAQEFRPFWGPLVVSMNELTGFNDGDFNPDVIQALRVMSSGGLDEKTMFGMSQAFDAGIDSANPINPANMPVANAGAALLGFDLPMTRFADAPIVIKPADEQGIHNQALGGRMGKAISALVGASISHHITASVDFANALGQGGDLGEAAKVALGREKDYAASGNGPIESLLFKDYDKVISANDSDMQRYYKKADAMANITKVYRENIKYDGKSGMDKRVDELLPSQTIAPEYRNTMLAPVGEEIIKLNRVLNRRSPEGDPPIKRLNALKDIDKAIQDIEKQPTTTAEQKNRQRNDLLDERRELVDRINFHISAAEERIRVRINDPSFSLLKMDVEKLKKMPYDPVAAQVVEAPLITYDNPETDLP